MKPCPICNKPLDVNELGLRRAIHEECRAGEPNWLRWFEGLPESQRSAAGKLIYKNAMRKREQNSAKAKDSPFFKQGLTSESWKEPCLIVRLSEKGASIVAIMDRPFAQAKNGVTIRTLSIPDHPKRGFETLEEALEWARKLKPAEVRTMVEQRKSNGTFYRVTKDLLLTEVRAKGG